MTTRPSGVTLARGAVAGHTFLSERCGNSIPPSADNQSEPTTATEELQWFNYGRGESLTNLARVGAHRRPDKNDL